MEQLGGKRRSRVENNICMEQLCGKRGRRVENNVCMEQLGVKRRSRVETRSVWNSWVEREEAGLKQGLYGTAGWKEVKQG